MRNVGCFIFPFLPFSLSATTVNPSKQNIFLKLSKYVGVYYLLMYWVKLLVYEYNAI